MGQRIPPITGKELLKALTKAGMNPVRQRGSHVQLKGNRNGEPCYTTIPIHNRELPISLVLQILKDCRIKKEEFEKLREK